MLPACLRSHSLPNRTRCPPDRTGFTKSSSTAIGVPENRPVEKYSKKFAQPRPSASSSIARRMPRADSAEPAGASVSRALPISGSHKRRCSESAVSLLTIQDSTLAR
jgi:hypothetical protein